jgi:hypothetical protein
LDRSPIQITYTPPLSLSPEFIEETKVGLFDSKNPFLNVANHLLKLAFSKSKLRIHRYEVVLKPANENVKDPLLKFPADFQVEFLPL